MSMRNIKYLILILFLFSCTNFKYNYSDLQGIYKNKNDSRDRLIFEKDRFANVSFPTAGPPTFTCCDTVSYGKWGVDMQRGFIYLNSPESLNKSVVHISVKEKQVPIDSLIFIIDNPVEAFYKKSKNNFREVQYELLITDKLGLYIKSLFKNE